jgi:hypothetical protein
VGAVLVKVWSPCTHGLTCICGAAVSICWACGWACDVQVIGVFCIAVLVVEAQNPVTCEAAKLPC